MSLVDLEGICCQLNTLFLVGHCFGRGGARETFVVGYSVANDMDIKKGCELSMLEFQQAVKRAAPAPTNDVPPSSIIAWATVQYAPAARQNPVVAERKMPTKMAFVRGEHIMKTKERRPMKRT
jgi:hypothetical protein